MPLDYVLLCLASVAAGAINSVAGGGTLLTFPSLFAVLGYSAESAVIANCTSTVALMPGSLAAAWGYRREVRAARQWFSLLAAPSLLGGLLGSVLLTALHESSFERLVPWLILTAAVLFAVQPSIARWTGIGRPHAAPTSRTKLGILCFQFLVAVYGGYFGAGIGILMLTALSMMGLSDIHQMNGLKTVLASLINGVSVVWFIWQGRVDWRYGWIMVASAIVGGYLGASVARRMNRDLVRRGVVVIGLVLAGWYFWRQFAG